MSILSSDLRKYNFFSSLSDTALESIAEKLRPVNFKAGSVIVKEGEVGDSFYFVQQGQLEVTKKAKSGQDAKLSVIGSGQGFGEMALLTCTVRSSSVRAITDVTLYELAKTDFEDIVLQEAAFKNKLLKDVQDYTQYNKVKAFQPFALLTPEKMYVLMEKMSEKTYEPGEDIIVQGEKGDNYYIIKSGRVAVLKRKKGEDKYKEVAMLGDGEAFGEEALIRDEPRKATCRAVEKTSVLVLNKKDFNHILKAEFLDNIFPEDINLDTYLDDYMIIDVRIPSEYEEEHIYGAVNIPIEVLRQKCIDFNKSKKYITYCLYDSRCMVAAFLLKSRGFDAKCLRSGISGWMGELVTGSDGIHMPEP